MSFKSIFNWLYAATLDRAMNHSVSRRSLVGLSPRTLLVALLLLVLGGWNSEAWGAVPVYNGGTWYSLYKTDDDYKVRNGTILEYSDVYAPTNGQCIFDYKKYSWLSTNSKIEVQCDGTTKNSVTATSSDWTNNYTMSGLPTNYSKITLKKTSGDGAQARNVRVVLAKHILLDDGSTYGTNALTGVALNATAYGKTSDAYHINLRSFYVDNTTIKYESDNSEFHFGNGATTKSLNVKANSCAASGGSANSAAAATTLGNPDNQEVDLYFTPSSNKNGSSSATITIYDGTTKRATITVSAKVIPTYYFKATAVATAGGAEVKASFTEGSYSAASETTSVTATKADVASLTKTAYFYAPLSKGDYYFQGWYAEADCSGTRLSTEQTLTRTITANSLNSASPSETKYYAQYKQVIRAEFSGAGQSMMVDGTYDGISYIRTSSETASASSSDGFWYEIRNNTPSGNTTGSTHPSQIISYNPSTKVVTAHNAGTATLVLHQKNVGLYEAIDKEYTFTVYKYNSIFANVADLDVKVDENVSSVYTLTYTKPNVAYIGAANHTAGTPTLNSGDFYYTLTQDVQTSVTTGSPEPSLAITYNAGTKTATGKNAGKGTVHLYQRETYKYNAADEDFDVTVTKHSNTIKVKNSTSYSSSIYVDSYDNELTLTADNTDYTNYPITNTQKAGEDIATYYQGSNVVYSSYKLGTATWTLSQPENYKYQAGSGSFTVTVAKAAEAADCYVYSNNTTEYNIYASGGLFSYNIDGESIHGYRGDGDPWFTLTGPGDKLYFNARKSGGDHLRVLYSTDNQSTMKLLKEFSLTSSYTNYNCTIPEGTTDICFFVKYGETYTKYYRDIYVTRKTYLNAEDVTIDRTSTSNPIYPSDGTGVGTLTIDYSLANGGDLHIYNDNPEKFTLSQTTISSVDCKTGTATINISYESDEAGTDVAHLVIYNKVYRKEVTVTGITAKRNQEVHWEIGDALRVGTQTENAAWVTIGSEVSYSSSNTTLLEVVDGKLVAKAEGEVTITATAPGNGEYYDAEGQKTITITNDLIQSIVWEQNFLRLKLGGANQTLNAYAVSDVEDCTTDRARLITYESSDESVVKVINSNQLQIVGAGPAILTAHQAGGVDADGHKYMAVSKQKAVVVRDPNAPCDNYLYIQPQENKWDCGWNHLSRKYKEFVIDNLDEPSTLYLQYKGEYRTVAGVDYFYGTMHVDEWYDDDWHEVPNGNLGTPSIGTYKTLNTTLQRKTTKVRISTHDGVGYHYFKDCKIGQSRYIEASDLTTFEAKVGQVVNQQLTIRYNNITGPVTLSLGSNNSKFSLSQQSIDGDCGDKETVDVTVSYLPTVEADEEELLTVSDGTTTLKVTLHGVATKTSRHIVWDLPETNNVHTVDVVELGAQTLTDVGNTTAGDVFYAISSSSPAGVGSVAGSNLTFAKAGTVVVTANTVNDARYNDAVAVSKTYNVAITPTAISTMPVLAEVTSGTAAGEIELTGWQVTNTVNGGVVEGTLAITSVDLINAGTNTVTLTFTPDNTDMYSGCTGTTTITVNKVTSTATPSASNIIYGQTLNSSTLTNTGTEGTWTWKTADNTAILPAGTHEGLAVHFTPTSSNYTELDGTVSLTVLKAEADATPAVAAITYGQKVGEATLTNNGTTDGAWALVGVNADEVKDAGSYELDVHFTPTSGNYNEKDAVVTLTVNKAASEATPSAPAIKEGQKVSESVLTNSGTAGTWAWDAAVADNTPAAGTYNYTVHFTPENANYTELTTTVQLQVNVPVYNFTNANGDGNWDDPDNWEGGSVPDNNSDVIISGNLTINDSRTVGDLTIENGASVQVVVSGNLTVTGASEDRDGYGDLVIANGGEVNVTGTLKVHDLVIASKSCTDGTSISGQLTGESNITNVDGDVYIDITLVEGALDDSQWYGFTVPFEVDAEHGVYRYENGNVVPLTWGNQYDIANYDSNKRYNTGKGWQYYRGTLNPGEFYYITLDGTYNVYRFKKKASSAISSGNTKSLNLYGANPASKDANWNPVGNPTLTYAITDYSGYVQIYQNGQSAYKAVPASEATFVVGCPFFIQAAEAGTLTLNEGTKTQLYAPARGEEKAFNILMQAETGGYADNIYLNTSDEADGTYRVGHDLLKAGTSKLVPQLWIAQGEDKLCVNEAELNNNNAYATLGLYAPTTGNYVLDIVDAPQDATLYLTYDGTVIWNLSESAYTLSLMKGTTANYGLQLVREARNTATGVEQVGSETQIQKFIHNGVLYINKDGVLYDAMGKKVK